MESQLNQLWGRKASLTVTNRVEAIDLSELRYTFLIRQSDQESPNNAVIRVYNLSDETVNRIISLTPVEFTRVILQAGYENANYGVIFDGTIKQFKRGKENATDTYLDILAAHGDYEYNFGMCNTTLAAESTPQQRIATVASQMGLGIAPSSALESSGGVLARGKTFWGLGRYYARCEAASRGATWSIQDGRLEMIPVDGYLDAEAVVLTSQTGLIGRPEQTEQGIKARCLINPKMRIGTLVQIDNASINQTTQADLRADGFNTTPTLPGGAQLPFDRRTGIQQFANVTSDGFYRVIVIEYSGDTRGQEWYADLICLAVDKSVNKVLAQ